MAYTHEERIDIFRGQCFNNACVLLTGVAKSIKISHVFELAQRLFDDGMEREWVINRQSPNLFKKIDKSTGKVQIDLTDKEVKEWDKDDDIVI